MGASPLNLAEQLNKLRARPLGGGSSIILSGREQNGPPLSLGLAAIDAVLPDGGLPRGAVVELCAPDGLGQSTRVMLAACAAAQQQQREETIVRDRGVWCAWLDPAGTLFAPAVLRAGIDLERLLIIRPPVESLARVAVRVAASRVFSLIVLDRCGVPGAQLSQAARRWDIAVRRLALAVEASATTVVLLSRANEPRRTLLPVALRLELGRPSAQHLSLRVAKERHGRLSGPHWISLAEMAAVQGDALSRVATSSLTTSSSGP